MEAPRTLERLAVPDPTTEGRPERWGNPPEYTSSPSPAGGDEFHRLGRTLRRRWWVLFLTLSLGAGLGVTYLRVRPPRYVSKAVMWVAGKLQMPEGARFTEDLQNFFGTQIELLQTDRMQERAYLRAKSTHPGLEAPKDELGKYVLPVVRINQTPKSSVFYLESTSTNAGFAQMYLDALMDEFLNYKKEVRAATSGDALASISTQVYKQEGELKAEQDKLSAFQRENNVALLEEQVKGGGNQLAQLQTQLSLLKLELQLLDAAALEQSVGAQAKTNLFAAAPDPRRLTDSSSAALPVDFVSANQQVQVLKVQREQLSRFLRPKHPKIVKLDDEIAQAEKVIEFFRQQTQEQLATAKQAMRIRIESLTGTITELEDRVGAANRRLAELERIQNGIQRQQSLYDRLLMLLQGVDLNRNLDQENVTILQRASSPEPDRQGWLVLALAVFGGGMLGLLLVFVAARADDRCESLEELRREFGEEIVGQMPEVRRGRKARRTPLLLQAYDQRHVFAESCRNLRSSLLYRPNAGVPAKTLLITSAAPNEGKSTVAANLARALALGGARVLLVDADLRRGRLHDLLGVAGEPGLADLLQDSTAPASFVPLTISPNLFFLPRGKAFPGTGELFLTPAFDALLRQSREQFDYLILDSIPVFAADDTTTLAPKLDAALFVVRRSYTSTRLASQALELLYQRQVRVLGLVFNRADADAPNYRYYRYSGYRHAAATGA